MTAFETPIGFSFQNGFSIVIVTGEISVLCMSQVCVNEPDMWDEWIRLLFHNDLESFIVLSCSSQNTIRPETLRKLLR
jgi:hypothetical protein